MLNIECLTTIVCYIICIYAAMGLGRTGGYRPVGTRPYRHDGLAARDKVWLYKTIWFPLSLSVLTCQHEMTIFAGDFANRKVYFPKITPAPSAGSRFRGPALNYPEIVLLAQEGPDPTPAPPKTYHFNENTITHFSKCLAVWVSAVLGSALGQN